MAFVLVPLSMMLFGIIVYGYLMSFRQNMTQAAAEGARAGAVAPRDNDPLTHVYAYNQALAATEQALGSFDESCTNGRMTCEITFPVCPDSPGFTCVTVTVRYDYEHHALMPDIPLVSAAIPSEFVSSSTAQINQ
jgi:Flp pilus assembly protein TadG